MKTSNRTVDIILVLKIRKGSGPRRDMDRYTSCIVYYDELTVLKILGTKDSTHYH